MNTLLDLIKLAQTVRANILLITWNFFLVKCGILKVHRNVKIVNKVCNYHYKFHYVFSRGISIVAFLLSFCNT